MMDVEKYFCRKFECFANQLVSRGIGISTDWTWYTSSNWRFELPKDYTRYNPLICAIEGKHSSRYGSLYSAVDITMELPSGSIAAFSEGYRATSVSFIKKWQLEYAGLKSEFFYNIGVFYVMKYGIISYDTTIRIPECFLAALPK